MWDGVNFRNVTLALVLGAAITLPTTVTAGTATARFGLRLVIEPACPDDAPKLVATSSAAIDRASAYLKVAPQSLRADHDRDTGYWLVSSDQRPAVRIAKCTGDVSLAEAPTQNGRSVAGPAPSLASG